MTTRAKVRSALGSLYVIAILVAVFFASGQVVGAVAAIGALAVGVLYRLLTTPDLSGDRAERRAASRARRRDRP